MIVASLNEDLLEEQLLAGQRQVSERNLASGELQCYISISIACKYQTYSEQNTPYRENFLSQQTKGVWGFCAIVGMELKLSINKLNKTRYDWGHQSSLLKGPAKAETLP